MTVIFVGAALNNLVRGAAISKQQGNSHIFVFPARAGIQSVLNCGTLQLSSVDATQVVVTPTDYCLPPPCSQNSFGSSCPDFRRASSPVRSSTRLILPEMVLGKSANWMQR